MSLECRLLSFHRALTWLYIIPRVEGAGSFLRPDAKGLDVQGRTFEEAVRAKYLDDDGPPASADHTAASPSAKPASDAASTSQRFATDSNFEVEVVLSDKVNRRFKQLGRLREIGLEWETVSRAAEEVYCEEEQERVEARLRSFGDELSGEFLNSFDASACDQCFSNYPLVSTRPY